MEHGVNCNGFQSGVPGPSGLSCPGVHLCGGEADVSSEGQDQDAYRVMVLLGDGSRGFVNHDIEDGPHQGQGLLQRDDPGQGRRCD